MKGPRAHWNMAQMEGTIPAFQKFLKQERFERIIEIGTGSGMFTRALAEMFKGPIMTFDIAIRETRVELPSHVDEFIKDVFDPLVHELIREQITSEGRVLLLCDGGNKPKEVNTFGVYLKPGDVIMAHDFGDEIHEESVKVEKLEPFYQDLFLPVCWMCKRRSHE